MHSVSTTARSRVARSRVAPLVVASVIALGSAAALALPLLPSAAGPETTGPRTDPDFRPVGDGALPERAPKLGPTDAPLSVAERGYAIHLAQGSIASGASDVLGNPGGEVLAADLPPLDDRGDARRATVALYDYGSDRLHQLLVDLSAGSVLRSRDVRGLQLPPTAAETAIATQLALAADPAPAFVRQFRRLTGTDLIAAEQVRVVAGVWRSVGGAGSSNGVEACGRHRCLQLLIALPSGQYLATHDFAVDLSSRAVLPVTPVEQEHDHDAHAH